ncbi:MAG TPA: carbohydrate ABC transporter permease [Kofleriaceae bacterium]|nr:carbohydrate ABC transporter permease [Kofleriaceae bacterium]
MRSGSRAWRGVAIGAVLVIIVVALTPYIWMFLTSFKNRLEVQADKPVWTFSPTFEHYGGVFIDKKYLPLVWNSVFIATGTTILSLLIGVPAAYVFARSRFRGKEDLFFFFLTTRMAPAISVVVPMYLLFNKLGLLDTRVVVVLAHSTFNLSLVVWMMRGFFADIPPQMDEAAQLDGHTRAGAFVRVILPLAAPGIAATAVLCFIMSWNEFLYAFILASFESRTLTVGIPGLVTPHGTLWGQVAAVAVVATLPIILFTIVVQRHLVRGLTFGAVKG